MINWLKKLFIKNNSHVVQPTGYIYEQWNHSSWGNHISILSWDKRRIYGHMFRIPRVGDEIRFKMESGKIGRFLVVRLEHCSSPSDMFFAG